MKTRYAACAFALLLLPGCDSAARRAEAAEREYRIVKSEDGGDWDRRCVAARKVADAWLEAEDREKYGLANIDAGLDCNAAEQRRLGI